MTSAAELAVRHMLLPRLEELIAAQRWDEAIVLMDGQPLLRHIMYTHASAVDDELWLMALSVAVSIDANEMGLQ